MQNDATIIRSSLGRMANLGDLYDARKDDFVGINIFRQTLPEISINCKDNPQSSYAYKSTNHLAEKFSQFNVNAELQLSILAGMVKLQGSGNYLQEEKASAKAVRMTLLYSIQTKSESINISNSELKEIIDLNTIDNFEATHVVVGIDWGANCTITAEDSNEKNEERKAVEGRLNAAMNKITESLSGKGEAHYENQGKEDRRNFSIRSNCDIVTTDEELPTTLEQAIDFVKKLPRLIRESNNGKGKPLSYTLLPISSVRKYLKHTKQVDIVLKQLREEAILRFVHLFDEISLLRQEIYDFAQYIQLNLFCISDHDWQKVTKLKNNFSVTEANLRSDLNQTLVDVRSGKNDASKLNELISNFENNEFSTEKVRGELQSFNSLKERIELINDMSKQGIDYIGKSDSLERKYLVSAEKELYILFFFWSKKNDKLWEENVQLFMSLQITHSNEKEKYKFIIVDGDLKAEYNSKGMVIAHYVDGQCRCEDVLKRNRNKVNASLCLAESNDIENNKYSPKTKNRIPIKLLCPGSFNGSRLCENSIHQWLCNKCKSPLEYGFDDYFYCLCGKSKITTFKYRCNSDKHGSAFISYAKNLPTRSYMTIGMPEIGLVQNPEPRCPLILLLDSSSSMKGQPIEELNKGLMTFTESIQKDELASKRVEVAIVSFGPVRLVQDFVTVDDFEPPNLQSDDLTPMGEAIEYALDLLEKRKQIYNQHGTLYYRPWVWLITDGEPTDNWDYAAQLVMDGEDKKKFTFFAVGVQGANMNILERISHPKRKPLKLKELDFVSMFLWLSTSLAQISQSKAGEQIPLPPLGWNQVSS